jgi:16S rRNA (guanine966-N2)-methyltransferase
VPESGDLRPTPDRVRETLFNWLGQTLAEKSCLDLFAGSGALGFEAASRGAARVVMVENDRAVFSSLKKTSELIGTKQVELVLADAFAYQRGAASASTWFSSIPRSGRMRCPPSSSGSKGG